MLSLNDVSLAFGSRVLFSEATFHLTYGSRYGLVGANGTGKSTLLRLLSGEESPTLGEVTRSRSLRLGYLRQDRYRFEGDRIIDVVIQGRPRLWEALQEKERLLSESHVDEAAGFRIAELEETIAQQEGYVAGQLAEELLCGLGLSKEVHDQPLKLLSGGYKLRVLLAQALFDNPDALLLDEPTNYLDIVSIAWLEDYLVNRFRGILVFVSHDVGFLSSVATHILDIDYGEVILYPSGYHRYLQDKQAASELRLKAHASLERYVARQKVFIERFRSKATRARQAQSREKQLERVEWPDLKTSSRVFPNFVFDQRRASGRRVLRAIGIAKSFGDRDVLYEAGLEVERGERVAIVGPNGAGKSTLLKILIGECAPDAGEYSWGHETHTAFFAQEAHETADQSLVEYLAERVYDVPTAKLYHVLGSILFSQEEIFKKVSTLSGGELARLRLGLIMLQQPNVLILDEPTNHLDLEAREALAKALANYAGTVLVVSHDRGFLKQFATRVIRVNTGGLEELVSSDAL